MFGSSSFTSGSSSLMCSGPDAGVIKWDLCWSPFHWCVWVFFIDVFGFSSLVCLGLLHSCVRVFFIPSMVRDVDV